MKHFPKWIGRVALGLSILMFARNAGAAPQVIDTTALRNAIAAERMRPRAPQLPRIAFLAQSTLLGAWLSPDGTRVAFLRETGRHRSVWIMPTTGEAPTRVLAQTEAERLAWSRDGRWLFLESPRPVFALAVAGGGGSRGWKGAGRRNGQRSIRHALRR
jgi:hypothetical protein